MSLIQTKNIMTELKLHGMCTKLGEVLESRRADSGFIESLSELLQAEFDDRCRKQTERIMKNSKLTKRPLLEDFDSTVGRTVTKSQVKDLYELSWLENKRSIVIVGPTGVGKTFLAQAIGAHCCANRITTLFVDMSQYLEELNLARATSSYLKHLKRLARPQLLIFDDFGLRKLSTDRANDLCDLLKARIDKSTVITTQLPIKNWQEVIEDPVIADTIIDRMIHTSIVLDYKGPTYREVQGRRLRKAQNGGKTIGGIK